MYSIINETWNGNISFSLIYIYFIVNLPSFQSPGGEDVDQVFTRIQITRVYKAVLVKY